MNDAVATRAGRNIAAFRWLEVDRTDDPRQILQHEGVRFSTATRADPSQRLTVEDLERLRSAAEDDTDLTG